MLSAGNAHQLHSPFAYELYTRVIDVQKNYYSFSNIEALRIQLSNDQHSFEKKN